jgi:hypothetical protein
MMELHHAVNSRTTHAMVAQHYRGESGDCTPLRRVRRQTVTRQPENSE